MREAAVSDPSRLAALALVREGGSELLLANLTPQLVEAALEGWAEWASVAVMDAETWDRFRTAANGWEAVRRASSQGCRLPPFAVASVEFGGDAR